MRERIKKHLEFVFGPSPPMLIMAAAAMAGLVMVLPIGYVFLNAIRADPSLWRLLFGERILFLLWNTTALAVVVTAVSAILGTVLAFLVVRTDMPGSGLFRWLLVLPMAFPSYVGALTYIILFGPRGWVRELAGWSPFPVYESLWGTAIVLILFNFPYVFLIVTASLRRLSASYEETGLACGLSYPAVVFRVIFPMLRPAIGAGALLTALCVFSDFGAVAMLRYETFVSAIYYQIEGRFDRTGAAVLSSVLILITLGLLWLEARSRGKRRYSGGGNVVRRARGKIALGKWKVPAFLFAGTVFVFSVLIPVIVLCYWSIIGISDGALSVRFWEYMGNSIVLAASASFACMALAVPVVYLRSRHPSLFSRAVSGIAFTGYALPGVIVALGVIFFFHRFLPILYATMAMAAAAHFMRFLPQGLAFSNASLARVSPTIDEAAKSLGSSPGKAMVKVIFPLMLPGVLAGGAMVFVSSLKELPATLLLRPPGFDTLSVRVWQEAHEGFYANAAPAALLIVLVAALPIKLLMKS